MISLNTPYLHGNEKAYLNDVIDSGWLARGPYNERFEQTFAQFSHVSYGLSVTSGTVAVQVLLMAAGMQGKKVAVPAYTCMSVAQAVVHAGCIPVFVDIEPDTLGMDIESVKRMYTQERFAAVLLNHLYGFIARDTQKIQEFCKEKHIQLLEDASEAHGAENSQGIAGSFGRGAAFSMRSEKMMGVGEGGMVITNDKTLWDQAYYWINDARPSNSIRYYTTGEGWNFFMPNALGAIGLAQVEQLPEILKRKRAIGRWYEGFFQRHPQLHPQKRSLGDQPVYWLNVAVMDDSMPIIREDLLVWMKEQGIEMRPGFYPLHVLPSYRKYPSDQTPVSQRVGQRLLAFPSATDLGEDSLTYIEQCWNTII